MLRYLSLSIFITSIFPVFALFAEDRIEEIRGSRPNILICMADDASYPHFGANGCSWIKTPGFDRVCEQGLRFTRAYTPNAKCSPSRACFLTGRNPWQLEAAGNHIPYFPPKFTTYPEALVKNGYFVGMTQKGWAPGVALDEQGKPRQMTGKPFNARKLKSPTSGISNNDYAANFNDFLDAKPAGQPWCFWYGCVEPHRAYEYGTGVSTGGKSTVDIDRVPDYWPDNETVRNDMLDYAFELEHFDRHLLLMLENLERRGELENTVVIVTADNGMPFPRAKGQSFEISCHLPFAIMWKTKIAKPGRSIDDYISFIDVVPTLLDLVGLTPEEAEMQPVTGKSLVPILLSDKDGQVDPTRNFVLLGRERNDVGRPEDQSYPIRAFIKKNFLYIHNFKPERWPSADPLTGYLDTDGSPTKTEVLKSRHNPETKKFWDLTFAKRGPEELYNLNIDPDCLVNLARDASQSGRVKKFREELFTRLTVQEDPRLLGLGDVYDHYPHAHEGTRNFYNRFKKGEKIDAGWVNPSDFENLEDQ